MKSYVIYESELLTLCCLHANVHVYHKDLLPAGREQVLLILVPHIDSRVTIIDNERPGASTHIILKINVMICIYFVLIWTLSLCNLCNIGLENKVIITRERSGLTRGLPIDSDLSHDQ